MILKQKDPGIAGFRNRSSLEKDDLETEGSWNRRIQEQKQPGIGGS
jgi:hypothetical protein